MVKTTTSKIKIHTKNEDDENDDDDDGHLNKDAHKKVVMLKIITIKIKNNQKP